MTTRDRAPSGAPCWADLWTSDVEGSAKFYGELFGWEAQDPSPEFGGYFMFTRDGVPVAGGMGDMGEMRADNTWKVYLATDDIAKTIETAETEGAQIQVPSMPVADLGIQAVLSDPTGATIGAWQPGTRVHGSGRAWGSKLVRAPHAGLPGRSSLLRIGLRMGIRDHRGRPRLSLLRSAEPRRWGACRNHGCAGIPPRGCGTLVGRLLGGRRRERFCRGGEDSRWLDTGRCAGHALRSHGHGGRPVWRRVQAAYRPRVSPARWPTS
jgi:predicted enzyme related to lactoylglutathione lyase